MHFKNLKWCPSAQTHTWHFHSCLAFIKALEILPSPWKKKITVLEIKMPETSVTSKKYFSVSLHYIICFRAHLVYPRKLECYLVSIGNAASINVSDNKALWMQCNNSKENKYLILIEACMRSFCRKYNNSKLCRQLHVQCGSMVLLLGQWELERRVW